MSQYRAKDSLVQDRQLKVLDLSIPLLITANATPASKSLSNDEPARLFLQTEGLTQITLANGAVDSAAELSAITFVAANDAAGQFSFLLRLNEPVVKVICATLVRRNGNEIISASLTSAPSSGITSAGDKIVMNCDSAINFSTTDYNATLIARVEVLAS